MDIASATFFHSAPDLDSCPDESLPEFAFIGRSNVGKSSLLNVIAGKQGLARVSATPGFTKLINMFVINKTWRLVDLPGYGWAHVARQDKAKFNMAVANYLRSRPNLRLVFALVDSSLPPQSMDLEFVEWLSDNSIPFVLVFTKTDKAKPSEVKANIAAFSERISEWCENLPEIYTCSAVAKHGRRELLGVIDTAMADLQTDEMEKADEGSPGALPQIERAQATSREASGRDARGTQAKAAGGLIRYHLCRFARRHRSFRGGSRWRAGTGYHPLQCQHAVTGAPVFTPKIEHPLRDGARCRRSHPSPAPAASIFQRAPHQRVGAPDQQPEPLQWPAAPGGADRRRLAPPLLPRDGTLSTALCQLGLPARGPKRKILRLEY